VSGFALAADCDAGGVDAASDGEASDEGASDEGASDEGASEEGAPDDGACSGSAWLLARTGSGAPGIAAESASCVVGAGEAAVSAAGASGFCDWLQEAAAKPSAAQMSGKKILIMGAL